MFRTNESRSRRCLCRDFMLTMNDASFVKASTIGYRTPAGKNDDLAVVVIIAVATIMIVEKIVVTATTAAKPKTKTTLLNLFRETLGIMNNDDRLRLGPGLDLNLDTQFNNTPAVAVAIVLRRWCLQ
mmetsp:Transcript_27560/g.66244  ORF Transcript_27560/g.66244 Transcript_27560/m.66244 type:complete len:127 (+) Transcript_27560:1268-1648(+)